MRVARRRRAASSRAQDGQLFAARFRRLGEAAGTRRARRGPRGPADRLAVPVLLVAPAGQEGGDVGVPVGPGEQEVPQVAHGVALDVVHVAQAPEGVGGQGRASKHPRSIPSVSSLPARAR